MTNAVQLVSGSDDPSQSHLCTTSNAPPVSRFENSQKPTETQNKKKGHPSETPFLGYACGTHRGFIYHLPADPDQIHYGRLPVSPGASQKSRDRVRDKKGVITIQFSALPGMNISFARLFNSRNFRRAFWKFRGRINIIS